MGAGSAKPDVSITTRRKKGILPLCLLDNNSRSASFRSPRTAQQMQPLSNSRALSVTFVTNSWSSPISPNSFIKMAVSCKSGVVNSPFNRVVFPLPRKPVIIFTGVCSEYSPTTSYLSRLRNKFSSSGSNCVRVKFSVAAHNSDRLFIMAVRPVLFLRMWPPADQSPRRRP